MLEGLAILRGGRRFVLSRYLLCNLESRMVELDMSIVDDINRS